MNAIVPLTDISKRKEKRQFIKDAKKVALDLEVINQSFIWDIFNAPSERSYSDIYKEYSKKWQDTVKRLTTKKKIYNCGIDVLFFSREYSPKLCTIKID